MMLPDNSLSHLSVQLLIVRIQLLIVRIQLLIVRIQTIDSQDTTIDSQDTTIDSQDTTIDSQDTTIDSQDTTIDSQDTTIDSQDTTIDSQDIDAAEIKSGSQLYRGVPKRTRFGSGSKDGSKLVLSSGSQRPMEELMVVGFSYFSLAAYIKASGEFSIRV